jgi:hypothetical protein
VLLIPFLLWLLATLTPAQRTQRARIAALTRWSREDPKATAERAQAGLQRKFYNATNPELPEAERQRRAAAAYRADMSRIAFQRSKAKAAQAVEP